MRILLTYNPSVLPSAASSFYSNFHDGLEEAARELGHDSVRFNHFSGTPVSKEEHESLYRLLASRHFDLVIDLCCWSHKLSQLRVWDGSAAGELMYDAFECTYVGMLCDHPWFQPVQGMQSSRSHAAVPDTSHGEVIPMLHPHLPLLGSVFLPPATRASNDRSAARQKSVDVLYVGTLDTEALDRPWHLATDAGLCDVMYEWVRAHPEQPIHRALRHGEQTYGHEFSPAQMLELLRKVELCLRSQLRLDVVRAAAASGTTVQVVGAGWDTVPLPSNVVVHAALDYEGLLDLAGQSSICLDASTYRHGANDRVFNYTANNGVCFTNATGFLKQAFSNGDKDGGGLHFYSTLELEALGPAIRELLDSPARLREDAERARATTLAKHTWRHRLETLIAAVVPH